MSEDTYISVVRDVADALRGVHLSPSQVTEIRALVDACVPEAANPDPDPLLTATQRRVTELERELEQEKARHTQFLSEILQRIKLVKDLAIVASCARPADGGSAKTDT